MKTEYIIHMSKLDGVNRLDKIQINKLVKGPEDNVKIFTELENIRRNATLTPKNMGLNYISEHKINLDIHNSLVICLFKDLPLTN